MKKGKSKKSKIIIIITLTLLALLIWWPIWAMFIGSFFSSDEIKKYVGGVFVEGASYAYWPLIPSYPTFKPIIALFLDTPEFFVMFWNSCKMSFPQVFGQVLVGAPVAWAISRLKMRGRGTIHALYIVLMLLPFQVTMLPSYLIMLRLGLLDTMWAIILPGIFSAFPVFIMINSFSSIPNDLLESARLDGASEWKIFFRIGIPLGSAGILSAVVLGFLEAWSMIEQPLTFIKDKSIWPLSLYLSEIPMADIGVALISSFMTMAPAILIFFFGQKYLESGIQSSGMKE